MYLYAARLNWRQARVRRTSCAIRKAWPATAGPRLRFFAQFSCTPCISQSSHYEASYLRSKTSVSSSCNKPNKVLRPSVVGCANTLTTIAPSDRKEPHKSSHTKLYGFVRVPCTWINNRHRHRPATSPLSCVRCKLPPHDTVLKF